MFVEEGTVDETIEFSNSARGTNAGRSAGSAGASSRRGNVPRARSGAEPSPQVTRPLPVSGTQLPPQPSTRPSGKVAIPTKPTGYGWHLTRRLAAALGCAAVAAVLTYTSVNTLAGQGVDTLLMEAVGAVYARVPTMRGLITGIVNWPTLLVTLAVIVVVGLVRRRWHLLVRVGIVVLFSNGTTQLLKWLLTRPDIGPWPHLKNSLPSGFTTVMMSLMVAAVFVAPRWARLPAAVLGWVWVALMGVDVMGQNWHRPSDVIVAILIVGAWALALGPLESRTRHGVVVGRVMDVCAWVALVGGVVAVVVALHGVSVESVASRNQSGYGFSAYLATQTWRVTTLALGPVAAVAGVAGIVIREVDRLAFAALRSGQKVPHSAPGNSRGPRPVSRQRSAGR